MTFRLKDIKIIETTVVFEKTASLLFRQATEHSARLPNRPTSNRAEAWLKNLWRRSSPHRAGPAAEVDRSHEYGRSTSSSSFVQAFRVLETEPQSTVLPSIQKQTPTFS